MYWTAEADRILRHLEASCTAGAIGVAIWPFDPPALPMVVEIYRRILTGPVNKGSLAEGHAHLERQWPNLPEALRVAAESSEDAFDATV